MTITTDPLNALLAIRDGNITARWNFPSAVNTSLSNPIAGIGQAVNLTYGFLSAVPSYAPTTTGFSVLNPIQAQAARDVLTNISNVTKINFTEVNGIGNINFAINSQGTASSGYGYYPSYAYSSQGDIINSVTEIPSSGDVWLNSDVQWTASDFTKSHFGYFVLSHEMNHALGLKHPFEGTYTLDSSLDNHSYTVMSYTDAPNNLYRIVTPTTNGGYSWSYDYIYPETLMPADIAALQYLYGANNQYNTDDTLYTFDNNRPFIKTIWDAGGQDTISIANFSLGSTLNLGEGQYSSITILSDNLPLGYIETNTGIYNGSNNLAIAFGAIIENAIGGSGDDTLIGNKVNNKLTGGAGNDALTGKAGNDTLLGGIGLDTANYTGVQSDILQLGVSTDKTATMINMGAEGVDYLDGIEQLSFGDGSSISLTNLINTTAVTTPLFSVSTTGELPYALPEIYSGPVSHVQYQFLGKSLGDIVAGSSADDFLNLLGGDDAVNAGAGNDVIDGGTGSNFLTGGAGNDVFFVDGRGGATTWSTITDWQAGEQLSIWGWNSGVSTYSWVNSDGTAGFKGATLHADLNGDGAIDTSVTWAGLTPADIVTPTEFAASQLLWFV